MAAPAATSWARTSVVTVRFWEVAVVEVAVVEVGMVEVVVPGALEVVTPVEADDPEPPSAFGVEPEHPARATAATAPTTTGQHLPGGPAVRMTTRPALRGVPGGR